MRITDTFTTCFLWDESCWVACVEWCSRSVSQWKAWFCVQERIRISKGIHSWYILDSSSLPRW